jgi:hypothetical protein
MTVSSAMAGVRTFFTAILSTPPDDVPPCVDQANSFREVVSLQALILDIAIVAGVSLLYWWRQLPGQ